MILGYKQKFPFNGQPTRFKEKIINGRKKHSIRNDYTNRWKPGMMIQQAYGVRTKNYEQFATDQCVSLQDLRINELSEELIQDYPNSHVTVNIDGKDRYFFILLDLKTLKDIQVIDLIAYNDGFDSTEDFFKWFGFAFKGKIIHFTDLRY